MDFFGHQQKARRASKWLVLLFVAAVLCIIAGIYFAAVGLFAAADVHTGGMWQPEVLLAVTVGVIAIVGGAMLYKTHQLAGGGGEVARMLGGSRVDPGTTDTKLRMLHNVVEEMAIASGIPVPEVYVLDRETGLNAFAAGWGTKDAAVAVTRGLLDRLTRDELQGVVAHEFSHIFHGDMRLNIRLMGVLFGIVCIATVGRILVRAAGRGDGKKAGGIVLFGIALLIIGWLGVLFARLIQAAVSRQREFLADSSAVQYTRHPRGIGMALAKIGGVGGKLQNPHAEEASHMLFAEGVARFFGGAFATHPPVATRVDRILPGFRAELAKQGRSMTAAVDAMAPPTGAAGFAGGSGGDGVSSTDFVDSIGEVESQHVAAAKTLIATLPLDLVAAARDPQTAGGVALGLLLDREPRTREAQLQAVGNADNQLLREARLRATEIAGLPHNTCLPLLELSIPSLRALMPTERVELLTLARMLAAADAVITPFEFALLKTLERHVPAAEAFHARRRGRPVPLVQHTAPAATVIAAIAWAGADGDGDAARTAFAQGWRALQIGDGPAMPAAADCTIAKLEPSLDALAEVSPLGKRNLLAACAEAASADGTIATDELDLLRALAELWECPVPLLTVGPTA